MRIFGCYKGKIVDRGSQNHHSKSGKSMKAHHRALELLLSLVLLAGINIGYAEAPVLDPADDIKHLGPHPSNRLPVIAIST